MTSGVTHYKMMRLPEIEIGFPNGKVCCEFCRFCRKDRGSGIDRYECVLTWDLVSLREIGQNCPLKEVE